MRIVNKAKKNIISFVAEKLGYVHKDEIIKVFGGIPKLYPDRELLRSIKYKGIPEYFDLGPYKGLYNRIVEESKELRNRIYFKPEDFINRKTNKWEEIMFYVNQIKVLKEGKECLTSGFRGISISDFC